LTGKPEPAPETTLETKLVSAVQDVTEHELAPNRITGETEEIERALPNALRRTDPVDGMATGASVAFIWIRGILYDTSRVVEEYSIAELIAIARPAADPEFDLHTTWLEEIHNENSHKEALTLAVTDKSDEP